MLAVLVECILAERLLFPCHCRSLFFAVWKKNDSGKNETLDLAGFLCCSMQGPIYFPSGPVFLSLLLNSGGSRYVVCLQRDMCKSSLDTNYWSEIGDNWRNPTFSMIYRGLVRGRHFFNIEVCYDFRSNHCFISNQLRYNR